MGFAGVLSLSRVLVGQISLFRIVNEHFLKR
jgi:hypothetical protein